MRSRMAGYVTQIFVAFLLTGCTQCRATVKYQLGDKNVDGGQTLQWSFDRESVGGLPVGAQAFSGKWEVRAEADAPSPPSVSHRHGLAALVLNGKKNAGRCGVIA